MMTRVLLTAFFAVILSSCSTFGTDGSYNKTTTPAPEGTPTPTPTPPKKPEEVARCKISNGAGRVFNAVAESRDIAEVNARHLCEEASSRHCILLGCSMEDEEK